ncbi:MAG: hypothetical protein K8E66_12485, partial [Phycisphaerales bacterium]|nr:hypothetical protein [Phycisphaerales bacterium]
AATADLATSVAAGSIGSVEIADNSVSGVDILNGSITASDIASNAIGAAQIASNAVGAAEIASSAVGNSELASFSVTDAKIASNTVTSGKMLDEAGVAYAASATDFILTTGLATNVVQRTITVPASGLILANGRANFQIEHTGGIASEIFLCVSANSGVLDTANLSRHRVTSPDSFGAYRASLAVTDVFSVGAGTHTFYIVAEGDEGLGTDRVMDANLSLLFVPTAYGTVSATDTGPETVLADDR